MPSKKHKNKDDDIIVSTIGGQATGVTGSVTLVSYKKKDNTRGCILLELGGIQGNRDIKTEYIDNKKLLDKIKVENIDYVFVCHSHQDHEQHLPYLISHDKQFNGRIKGGIIGLISDDNIMLQMLGNDNITNGIITDQIVDIIKSLVGWESSDMVAIYKDISADEQFEKYFGEEGIKTVEQKSLSDI